MLSTLKTLMERDLTVGPLWRNLGAVRTLPCYPVVDIWR